MSDDYLEISAAAVPCLNGAPKHRLAYGSLICAGCGRHVRDLRCPVHEKVYSHNVELAADGGFRRLWICRVCLSEGHEPFPEAKEYQILRGRKLSAMATLGPVGGPVEDSPRPDFRVEYPGSFASKNFQGRP